MKYLLSLLFLLLFSTANAQKEKILSFHADVVVDTTSTITVTETITVYGIERGISRVFPLTRTEDLKTKKVKYKVISVSRNGYQLNDYSIEIRDGVFHLIIDYEKQMPPRGTYTYKITYSSEQQISFFDTYDELYWDVNGTHWDMPVDVVTATVQLPESDKLPKNTYNTSDKDPTAATKIDDRTLAWRASNLRAGEGLTVHVTFPKGIVRQPPLPPPPGFMQEYSLIILAAIFLIIMLVYCIITWRKYGVNPPKPTVYPQFNVPENLSPASMGYLRDERYSHNLNMASIVNLAVKGYIHIRQSENRALYELTKKKKENKTLPEEERILMKRLFNSDSTITLSEEYEEEIKGAVNAFRNNIKAQHQAVVDEGQNHKFLIFPALLIILFLGISFIILFQTVEGHLLQIIFQGLIMPPLFFAVFHVFKPSHSDSKPKRRLFIQLIFMLSSFIGIIIVLMIFMPDITPNLWVVPGFFVLSLILVGIYQHLIKRPSEEKLRIQSLIDGFKMYLGAAEEKQLQHFNPPTVTPERFEKLLPYAMALGVDKIWGEKFQRVFESGFINSSEYHTTWYSDDSSINAAMFADTLSSSMSSLKPLQGKFTKSIFNNLIVR